jgi:hypothetical protein
VRILSQRAGNVLAWAAECGARGDIGSIELSGPGGLPIMSGSDDVTITVFVEPVTPVSVQVPSFERPVLHTWRYVFEFPKMRSR